MKRKEAFEMRPPSQYRKEEFYWRGSDVYTEQEYLREEFKKAQLDFQKAQENYRDVEQELAVYTEILNDRKAYTDELAAYLDGDIDENRREIRTKNHLHQLEMQINLTQNELNRLKNDMNPGFWGNLRSELAYYMIEVKRMGKSVNLNKRNKNRATFGRVATKLSKEYQDVGLKEYRCNYIKYKNKRLKQIVDDLNTKNGLMQVESPDRTLGHLRHKWCTTLKTKINVQNLKIKQELRQKQHEMYIDHLFSIIEELNEEMDIIGMPEEDKVDMDDVKYQVYPPKTDEQIMEEEERKAELRAERRERKEERRKEIFREVEREHQNEEERQYRIKQENFNAIREQTNEVRAKSEQEREIILAQYYSELKKSSRKEQNRPEITKPVTPRSNGVSPRLYQPPPPKKQAQQQQYQDRSLPNKRKSAQRRPATTQNHVTYVEDQSPRSESSGYKGEPTFTELTAFNAQADKISARKSRDDSRPITSMGRRRSSSPDNNRAPKEVVEMDDFSDSESDKKDEKAKEADSFADSFSEEKKEEKHSDDNDKKNDSFEDSFSQEKEERGDDKNSDKEEESKEKKDSFEDSFSQEKEEKHSQSSDDESHESKEKEKEKSDDDSFEDSEKSKEKKDTSFDSNTTEDKKDSFEDEKSKEQAKSESEENKKDDDFDDSFDDDKSKEKSDKSSDDNDNNNTKMDSTKAQKDDDFDDSFDDDKEKGKDDSDFESDKPAKKDSSKDDFNDDFESDF